MKEPVLRSVDDLRKLTPARVALGCAGASLPTKALLAFTLDHARARDAVHAAFDPPVLVAGLEALGCRAVAVASRAGDRQDYLKRPDLGRRLDQASIHLLQNGSGKRSEVALAIGDGLSPAAVHAHAIPLMRHLLPHLALEGIAVGDVAVASGARVALGDDIGELVGARMVVVLIGERPGLSAPDSLGAYLTFGPRVGRTDAERNCVSNIRGEGLRRNVTGVELKDQSGEGTPARIGSSSALA